MATKEPRGDKLLLNFVIPLVSGLIGVLVFSLVVSGAVTFLICWRRNQKQRALNLARSSNGPDRLPQRVSVEIECDRSASSFSPRALDANGLGPLPEPATDTTSEAGSDHLPGAIQDSIRRRVHEWLRTAHRASVTWREQQVREPEDCSLDQQGPNPSPFPETCCLDIPSGCTDRVPPSSPPCLRPPPYSEAADCVFTPALSIQQYTSLRPARDLRRGAKVTPLSQCPVNDRPVFIREDSHEYLPLDALKEHLPAASAVLTSSNAAAGAAPPEALAIASQQLASEGAARGREPEPPVPPRRTSSLASPPIPLGCSQQANLMPEPVRLQLDSAALESSNPFAAPTHFHFSPPHVMAQSSKCDINRTSTCADSQSHVSCSVASDVPSIHCPTACETLKCTERANGEDADPQVDTDPMSVSFVSSSSLPAAELKLQAHGQRNAILEVEEPAAEGAVDEAGECAHANAGFSRSTENLPPLRYPLK